VGVSLRVASRSSQTGAAAMNWFQQNRWLGTFLIGFGGAILLSLILLWLAHSGFEEANARFSDAANERSRLERLDPFPSEANYRKMKVHLENYAASLDKFKEELKAHVLPAPPLAPNEFQSRLRQAMIAVSEKARANKVKVPDNFGLGFEEFTTRLPNTAEAPLLGQQLSQVELLMNILCDAHVDAVTALTRAPLPPEAAAATTKKPAAPAGPQMVERAIVDLTFTSSPSAARKVLNQIASSNHQIFITRTLHVRNEKEKGPPREQGSAAGTAATTAAPAKAPGNAALNFIVGNEHIETSARIELVRFTF
jgi:hypothetical protein